MVARETVAEAREEVVTGVVVRVRVAEAREQVVTEVVARVVRAAEARAVEMASALPRGAHA